jgi:hypothetical protein
LLSVSEQTILPFEVVAPERDTQEIALLPGKATVTKVEMKVETEVWTHLNGHRDIQAVRIVLDVFQSLDT